MTIQQELINNAIKILKDNIKSIEAYLVFVQYENVEKQKELHNRIVDFCRVIQVLEATKKEQNNE